jgi:tRNA pseudouridine38-40 synthase
MRIAIGMEYHGGAFCGWQTQPSGCGVQDVLEHALSEIAGEKIATICAGRTDTGVHALEQIVHFDTGVERPETAWVRGGNALLPATVAVMWARQVPDPFHARFSAIERCYRYVLLNHARRPALNHGRMGWFHAPLDVEQMQFAARQLLGAHDFSTFRSAECQANSPVRELRRLEISRRGDAVIFDLAANAFLHHMVRNIVGCLVYVGSGRHDSAWLAEILAGRDRRLAAPTFDAAGLYLARVSYDAHWALPQNARSAWFDS